MEFLIAYLALGAFVGFFAGMLGIGGGMTMVPVLVFLFQAQQFPDSLVVHLALGTAMASILFTSLSSVRAHHARGGVRWPVVRGMSPGILAGTLGGTFLAGQLSAVPLSVFFAAFVYLAATQLLINVKPRASRELPGALGLFAAGLVIGGVSALVAAGGAVMTIPFLTFCNVSLIAAIGTSSALGFPIAVAGTIGYILNGLGQDHLPPWSLGFVYLPALAGIVAASMLTAPLGARAAHRLPVHVLRRVFAVLLYALATKMLSNVW